MLHVRHLRGQALLLDGMRLASQFFAQSAVGAGGAVIVLCHWQPLVEELRAEELGECGAELTAHRTVEYEIDAGIE